jgi:hypothetical protein
MSPCEIEMPGEAGSLQIYGIGTALFIAIDDRGSEVVVRVTTTVCSAMGSKHGNRVNVFLDSPFMQLTTSGQKRKKIIHSRKRVQFCYC